MFIFRACATCGDTFKASEDITPESGEILPTFVWCVCVGGGGGRGEGEEISRKVLRFLRSYS